MFYIKTLLSGILFLNIETYPKEPLKILLLGAGIGTINYFFDKILKSNVQIDAVELSKKITKIGKDYFGMNNYDNEKKNISNSMFLQGNGIYISMYDLFKKSSLDLTRDSMNNLYILHSVDDDAKGLIYYTPYYNSLGHKWTLEEITIHCKAAIDYIKRREI